MMKFVINRKIFIFMLFIALTFLGVISYDKLKVELYPEAELPFLFVEIMPLQEVNPEYMENKAVIPVEGAIGTLEGIEKIESFINLRRGSIRVYYRENTDLKYAYLKLTEKIETVRSTLPEEFNVMVFKFDSEVLTNNFMNFQIRGSGGTDRVRYIADTEIQPELENIDGISNVEIYGGKSKSVLVDLDTDRMEALGITTAEIRSRIAGGDNAKTFVGSVIKDKKRLFVNVNAEYTQLSDLENIIIQDEGPVYLKNIAEISLGSREESSFSRINGKESVTGVLVKESRANLLDIYERSLEKIDELNDELKTKDIEIVVQFSSAEEISKNIDLIIELALTGGFLAVLVLWFFLNNFRLVFTIALTVPVSVYSAFNFFYYYGVTINSLTLIGMALAIGMLLDNSVVVLENIYRLASSGKNERDSVVQGTGEVVRSIAAATLTTVTVFLPFAFSSNFMISLLGYQIGVSIISTLLISLLVAVMLIPAATYFFLRRFKGGNSGIFQKVSPENRLIRYYLLFLKFSMRKPVAVMIFAVIFFFASVFISLAVSIDNATEPESGELTLYLTMEKGATLENTNETALDIEKRIEGIEEAGDIISQVYEGEATVKVMLKEDFADIAGRSLAEIKSDLYDRAKRSSAPEISFDEPQSSDKYRGGGGGNPGAGFARMLGIGSNQEKIVIKGTDFARMRKLADDIKYYLEDMSIIRNSGLNVADNRPEMHLYFDQRLMTDYNIRLSSVASELNTFRNEFETGSVLKKGTDEYDIIVRTDSSGLEQERNIYDLKNLDISSDSGNVHDLETFSRIIYSAGLSSINRVNQEKQIEVSYSFESEINDSKTLLEDARYQIDELIESIPLPAGIAVEVIHDETELEDFYFLIAAAFILIYMILASVFESLYIPFVLMFSIPLAAIGSFWGLILTDNSILSANSLTGFLILLGIVVNNGIILIDYARILRKRGYNRSRSIMTAGIARVRPILITAITTIVALIPLSLGKAEYVSIIGVPFAVTVIGGLSLSSLFTLIFIPAMYSGTEQFLKWFRSLSPVVQLSQIAVFTAGTLLIYFGVESFVWQMADLFLILFAIPSLTWFSIESLRSANEKLFDENEEITIKIQNIYKVYDKGGKFTTEWNNISGAEKRNEKTISDFFRELVWQLPLVAFVFWFTWIYLESSFWILLFTIVFYLIINYMFSSLEKTTKGKLWRYVKSVWYFAGPVTILVIYSIKTGAVAGAVITGLIWHSIILLRRTNNILSDDPLYINKIKGFLSGLRKSFYSFANSIPYIGKKRKPFKALKGVDLEIGSGMFGLLGPNGAGKTTLMRIICGILEQTYGKVYFNGVDANEKREELQGLIGYLPQEFGMYENMTAKEFLNYQAILKNIFDSRERDKRVKRVLEAVHMEENSNRKISSFSGGMKQRIGIAQILLHLPRILVVDEPTAGLDPRERIRFRNLLVELSRERIVIFSTHIIEDIASSCNKVAVLQKGELRYLGEPRKMTELAQGRIWYFTIDPKEFGEVNKNYRIIHHMRDKDKIRVRCLADAKPVADAIEVSPSLEDAYLYLQRQSKNYSERGNNEK